MELYVHIPFCVKKCRYCSFASYAEKETEYASYISLLLREAEKRAEEAVEPVHTVYIGGGTPSLLPPDLLFALIDGIRHIYGFDSVEEFTSEANPGTITDEWLKTAVNLGINRLSIGMQAYQDHLLKLLGRIHNYNHVRSSVLSARDAGIQNISLDLIFGIPGQSIRDWNETLDAALDLCPEHISAYGLIPEEGTPINRDLECGLIRLPDPDEERKMYSAAIRKLSENGYHQYEISNFAKHKYECRHNIGYWRQIPYIGLGLSAASMYDVKYSKNGMSSIRRTNPSSMNDYRDMVMLRGCRTSTEMINEKESRFETLMLGLRMNNGISEKDFYRMHRIPMELCYGSRLKELEYKGLMKHENGCWKLTSRGFDIQNSILVELMDE